MADFPSYLRQPGESSQAFAGFVIYRDLGPERSLKAVAERRAQATGENGEGGRKGVKRASGRIVFWSKSWRWVERAGAWDREIERVSRAAWLKEIGASAHRHAKLAMMLQSKALDRLAKLNVDELSVRDVLALMKLGIALERQAFGMDSELRHSTRSAAAAGDHDDLLPDQAGSAKVLALLNAARARYEAGENPAIPATSTKGLEQLAEPA